MRPDQMPVDYTISRVAIIAAARKWLGVPYKHQGRGYKGIDCIGLLMEVANEVGHPVFGPKAYSNMPKGVQLLAPCDAQLWKPERQKPRPGDIAIFWGWNKAEPQHVGFVAEHGGRLTVIHSYSKPNFDRVVEQNFDRVWITKFHCLYTLPGTEE